MNCKTQFLSFEKKILKMLAIRFHQKSDIFREKVYFFFKNVRKQASLQTKKYHFPLTTAPTFFRSKTQKSSQPLGFLELMILNDQSKNLFDFHERFGQKLTAKLSFSLSTKKNPNTTAIRFHQKPTIFKEKEHFFLKVFKKLMIQ